MMFFFIPFFPHDIGAFVEFSFFFLIFGCNILRYQAFRVTKMIDTLPTLATIDKRKEMKNL